MFKTLISTDVLAARLADPLWVIVDCRFKLDDVAWGERQWTAAHIPGAVYAHLDRDLSGPKTGTNGRHPLPDVDVLARSEEHTSELQSPCNLVCRLLLEKKKKTTHHTLSRHIGMTHSTSRVSGMTF